MVDELEPLDQLLTFGFSLSGQMDVDANEYNGEYLDFCPESMSPPPADRMEWSQCVWGDSLSLSLV